MKNFFKNKNVEAVEDQSHLLTKKGFSLVEVLIALVVLAIGMVSVSVLMTGSIKTSINSKNQIIASQLAQEGIEKVMNLKYNNEATFETEIVTGLNYRVDYGSDYAAFKASATTTDLQKKLYSNGTYFAHNTVGTTATKFSRKIEITNDLVDNVTVKSVVSWNETVVFPATCNTASKCTAVTAVLPYVD